MPTATSWRFDGIGTSWEIETPHAIGPDLRGRVAQVINDFDQQWSRFRHDSVVSKLAVAGSLPAPRDTDAMLSTYRELSAATDGAINPLIGRSLARRGYDADYSLVDQGATAAPALWQELLTWDDTELRLSGTEVIDVGALGKGRLVDLVMAELEPHVAGPILVDASGDLAVQGAARIGLEDPDNPGRVIGIWDITDAALCASAGNRRAWGEGLHHVLDARTAEPVHSITATWAVAPDAMHADAIATALFFEGGPELAAQWDVQWVRLTDARQVQWSPGATAKLFL